MRRPLADFRTRASAESVGAATYWSCLAEVLGTSDPCRDERPTLFHGYRTRRRRAIRAIVTSGR
jgi:hypothetical protein